MVTGDPNPLDWCGYVLWHGHECGRMGGPPPHTAAVPAKRHSGPRPPGNVFGVYNSVLGQLQEMGKRLMARVECTSCGKWIGSFVYGGYDEDGHGVQPVCDACSGLFDRVTA